MSHDEPPVIPVPPGAPPGYRGYGINPEPEPEPVPAPEPDAAPLPEPQPDWDPEPLEATEAAEEHELFTDSATVEAPEQRDHDQRDWLLRLPNGSGLRIDGMLLLGRSPDPAQGPAGAQLVPIDDPARTVSRSHLVIGPSGVGELFARNVSTVNAVVIIGADGAEFKIGPGGSAVLVEAARVLLGAYPITLERV